MKMITLQELKDRFHPNLTKQQFAEEMGLPNTVCCKMMKGKYDCSLKSKLWLNLCDYVRTKYNLQLVSENKFAIEGEKAFRVINNLKQENEELKRILKDYEEIIEKLKSAIRVKKEANDIIEDANRRLNMYK